MFYSSLITKIVGIFISFVSIFTAVYPGTSVTPNPVPEKAEAADIRVVSFNLRCTGIGNTGVEFRQSLLISQLNEYGADSMGFQEANLEWLLYLKEGLTDYDYVGRTRFDGDVLGEASPVFYRKDKYDVIDYDTFWLSKTPEKVGSKDWGSQNIRVCTWALLENKETKQRYVHFNTHLDHISSKAREEQMKVLLSRVALFKDEYPIVLTGDFNDEVGSAMYNEATEVLRDSRVVAPVTSDKCTFHNYGKRSELIDFVFVNDLSEPLVYHVIDDKLLGEYLSDHYGIYVDIRFAK